MIDEFEPAVVRQLSTRCESGERLILECCSDDEGMASVMLIRRGMSPRTRLKRFCTSVVTNLFIG